MGGVNRVYDDGGGVDAALAEAAPPDGTTGGADGGGGDDAGGGADAASDAAVVDTGHAEAGFTPDGAPEAEAGPVYACNGQPVTSCATCPGGDTVDCVFCAADGGHPLFCGPKQYCQNSAPPGAGACSCGGTPAVCPAASQVCTVVGPQAYCQTCGESGSGNHPCKGGGNCDEASGQCK
jgi:hypothetical protein